MLNLSQVRIILVETAGALNLGSVARVMKNMGLSQLVLVNPQCDRYSEEAQHMAVHAKNILDNAQIVADLPTALVGCSRAIATTSEPRSLTTPLEPLRSTLPWLVATPQPTALIFGREDSGLSNIELNYAQRFVAIPSHQDYPSLNLAQAVAICCYELHQLTLNVSTEMDLNKSTISSNISTEKAELVSLDALEMYYQQLEAVLLKIGYLYFHEKKCKRLHTVPN